MNATDNNRRGFPHWIWQLPLVVLGGFFFAMLYLHFRWLPDESDTPQVIRNAQPIIAALDRYHKENRTYPATLDELQPKYTEVIPYPGILVDRPFQYVRREETSDSLWTGTAPYALMVDFAPNGTFVYRPTRDYADLAGMKPGGKAIGEWYLSYID